MALQHSFLIQNRRINLPPIFLNFKKTMANDTKDTLLYAVLRLNSEITYTDIFSGEERTEKIKGVAGFIPCYATYEEAQEASCNGKYQVQPIKPQTNG